MRFQMRDGEILSMLHEYDGVLAFRHLKREFWPNATERAALKRLAKLVDGEYLARPTLQQRKTQPIPEPIYWLGWRGILWVAAQQGLEFIPPTNPGEHQKRRLRADLCKQDIHWLREPRWIQLAHDLTIVDFRFSVEQAVSELPDLHLDAWIHESTFRSNGDTVAYEVPDKNDRLKWMSKLVYPDSYFVVNKQGLDQRLLQRARFLLEVDNATHTRTRFGQEKVAPGLAYLKSPQYKARFGENSGRWLIITTGKIRMEHLMDRTREMVGEEANLFLFTTFDKLGTGNVLTTPIWRQVGQKDQIALFTGIQHVVGDLERAEVEHDG